MKDPEDREPGDEPRILIAAFNGWSDAGNAATLALTHLEQSLNVDTVHVIGADGYIDLQMYRPVVSTRPDGSRHIQWPDARLLAPVITPDQANSVIPDDPEEESEPSHQATTLQGDPVTNLFLFHATEPSHQWLNYADEVLDLVNVWDIDIVVFLGAMFSDAPHTRPIVVNLISDDQEIRAEFDGEESSYEGPVGITSILSQYLAEEGIPTVSLWAQVPHYVHSAPSPKATLALLDQCEVLLDIVIPRRTLLEEANDWERNIDTLASQDEEMTRYIERLEDARDSIDGPESTGEAIAHEFEKFLQIRPNDPPASRTPDNATSTSDPSLPESPAEEAPSPEGAPSTDDEHDDGEGS